MAQDEGLQRRQTGAGRRKVWLRGGISGFEGIHRAIIEPSPFGLALLLGLIAFITE